MFKLIGFLLDYNMNPNGVFADNANLLYIINGFARPIAIALGGLLFVATMVAMIYVGCTIIKYAYAYFIIIKERFCKKKNTQIGG